MLPLSGQIVNSISYRLMLLTKPVKHDGQRRLTAKLVASDVTNDVRITLRRGMASCHAPPELVNQLPELSGVLGPLMRCELFR